MGFALAAWSNGLIGVAVVWLILYPLMVLSLFHLMRQITKISLGDRCRFHRPVLNAVLFMMAVVLIGQNALAHNPPGFRLVGAITFGALSCGAWIWMTAGHTLVADLIRIRRDLRGSP